ncbi:hypothetical protein [Streptomyces sp.]|uniref:hypothetical protein n=1 Tax=Streptomyces sp. TaxID=1931 RepID=UPI002F94C0A7
MTTTTLPVTDDELRTIVGDQPERTCQVAAAPGRACGKPADWWVEVVAICDCPGNLNGFVCAYHKATWDKAGINCAYCRTPNQIVKWVPLR